MTIMASFSSYTFTLFLLLITNYTHQIVGEIEGSIDEGSCICGLNLEVLDKLESIVKAAHQVPKCTFSGAQSESVVEAQNQQAKNEQSNKNPTYQLIASSSQSRTPNQSSKSPPEDQTGTQIIIPQPQNTQDMMLMISQLTSEIHHLEAQVQTMSYSTSTTLSSSTKEPLVAGSNNNVSPQTSNNEEDKDSNVEPDSPTNVAINGDNIVDTGFLDGLTTSPQQSDNEALVKLNQSQKLNPQDMTSALQSTIPNVVSNIFSNIQNLTIQAQHNPINHENTLTSIDGSSVNIEGDSSEQIEAASEKLFDRWIDHQLEGLHLTAAAANYIRNNAINLFKRIVKQYIDRVDKLGGNIEANVQRATQMALNNTQNLIAFILRNYLNFAGGLMQIIGEQVSRVGKQLDSTGDTIAHINLNPFDIVSKVIGSLPNPSDYANYFRAFGKQLTGGNTSTSTQPGNQLNQQNQQQQESQKPAGLLSKTVGALSKTLGNWIG